MTVARHTLLTQARASLNIIFVRCRAVFFTLFPRHHGRVRRPSSGPSTFSSQPFREGEVFSCVIGSGDPGRKVFMRAELAKAGLEKSIWLRNPNRPDVPSDIVRAFKIKGAPMTEGEFSATLKHFMALHLFLQSDCELGLIMEDRIEFLGDFNERLKRYRAVLPGSFDILFEGDMMRIPGYGGAYSTEPSQDFSLFKMRRGVQEWAHGATNGANCYLITRQAAQRVVANFLPFSKVIDHHLNDIIRVARLNVYWPMPPAVHRRKIPSTVQFNVDGSPASLIT